MEKDRQFHLSIIRHANNNTLLNMYLKLNAHMQAVRFRFPERIHKRQPETNSDHEEILKGLKNRDAIRTKEAVRKHLTMAKEMLLDVTEI